MAAVCKVLLLLVAACGGQRKVLEKDNIAVEHHGAPLFALPGSSLRFSSPVEAPLKTRFESFNSDTDGAFVGHLMPLEPSGSMAQMTSLDVSCHHDKMDVTIVFDKPFNGMIYSKGYYDVKDCTYLYPNSNQKKVRFELNGQGCGVQFIEPPGKPAFMENVLILQNEPGIQEIWDTARGIRCLFDESLGRVRSRQTVSAALNVAMLEQQIVTFASSAKASAFMDIQVGRGPFAPSASGVVKIGELMTMVVKVEGPDEMDVLVRQCIAHDGTNDNTIDLTDQNGCVIKKKIIGSWQKKRNSGKSNYPVVAYAHFQAFKFPDKMDVYIECEIDLCNGPCPVCSDDAKLRKRRRRAVAPDVTQNDPIPSFETAVDELINKLRSQDGSPNGLKGNENKTENAALKLARKLRVLSPEDITLNGDEYSSFTLVTKTAQGLQEDDVCMSLVSFVIGIVVMLVILIASSVLTAILCIRVRTIPSSDSSFPPDSSFHAFSTVSGKTT